MKKLYWIFFVAITWCGCYEDKGNYDYRNLEDVQVAIKEEGPHSLMYGETLKLTSDVKTSIPDVDLRYDWEVQMDTIWFNPFVAVAQGRDLDYKWENAVLNKEKTYKMRLNVTQISNGRHFYSNVVDVMLSMAPTALGLMVLHGDENTSDIGVIEAAEFQLVKPATGFINKTDVAYYSAKNRNQKIAGKGTGLWQTFLTGSTGAPDNIVIIALTENSSAVVKSKTMEKEGEWNDLFLGGLNAGQPEGISMDNYNLYIFDGGDIFTRRPYKYRVAVPLYEYDEGRDGHGYRFYPQLFIPSGRGIGQSILFDVNKCGFVSVGQIYDFSYLALLDINEPGIQIPFNPGDMRADLLYWDAGGKYGMLAVMKSKSDGSYFIAEMNDAANDIKDFPKYKYELSHINDVKSGNVVDWAFGKNQINMGYYATPQGVYHFSVDDGNPIRPSELVMENNSKVEFDGDITLMKILKPQVTGGKGYYMDNVVMVVGTYGGTSGSGKLYSLELDPNSGKVKSQLGIYEGFDRIQEVEIKGY